MWYDNLVVLPDKPPHSTLGEMRAGQSRRGGWQLSFYSCSHADEHFRCHSHPPIEAILATGHMT
jgi:hypothetical protein